MVKYNVNACGQIGNELMIHFTKKCPNKCPFCIDVTNKGLNDAVTLPDVDKIYKRIMEYKDNIDSICISGGEPMLFIKSLLSLIKMVKENTKLKVYVISSIPKQCVMYPNTFKQILDLIDGLAISPQHYREEIASREAVRSYNNEIFRHSSPIVEGGRKKIGVKRPSSWKAIPPKPSIKPSTSSSGDDNFIGGGCGSSHSSGGGCGSSYSSGGGCGSSYSSGGGCGSGYSSGGC